MYIFDTNVLVEPFRLHYPFEICPGFWDWLDDLHAAGRLRSADAVFGEIVSA